MSRLIDADKLIEEIKQEIDMQYMYSPKGFINVVNSQPTAFDVDKVVEKLEEKREMFHEVRIDWSNSMETRTRADSRCSAYSEALKIIRAGGKDE